MDQYRPPGRSNRSGRTTADNDVFEGLPVKQWGQSFARVSLVPQVVEAKTAEDDRWAEPPMPRDYQLLQPWTQQLLRLARSGRIGVKRKSDPDNGDDDNNNNNSNSNNSSSSNTATATIATATTAKPDDEHIASATDDAKAGCVAIDDRGYVAKRWKPVPEHQLEPEHRHFEFLAKRRRGLPQFYAGGEDVAGGPGVLSMRKTIVQKAAPNGETAVYEVLLPEGTSLEGEITEPAQLAALRPVQTAPGTVIEGVGVANDEGVVVAEHLRPTAVAVAAAAAAARRNRPPANKKKGGPGRGKKRVTFTNPDGSTYTTVVPNAQKIVPQPGQTIKHVAKGEEATADVSAEQAAAAASLSAGPPPDGEDDEEGASGSDEGDDEGDEDDEREEGEISADEARTASATPQTLEPDGNVPAVVNGHGEDVTGPEPPPQAQLSPPRAQLPLPHIQIPLPTTSLEEISALPPALPEVPPPPSTSTESLEKPAEFDSAAVDLEPASAINPTPTTRTAREDTIAMELDLPLVPPTIESELTALLETPLTETPAEPTIQPPSQSASVTAPAPAAAHEEVAAAAAAVRSDMLADVLAMDVDDDVKTPAALEGSSAATVTTGVDDDGHRLAPDSASDPLSEAAAAADSAAGITGTPVDEAAATEDAVFRDMAGVAEDIDVWDEAAVAKGVVDTDEAAVAEGVATANKVADAEGKVITDEAAVAEVEREAMTTENVALIDGSGDEDLLGNLEKHLEEEEE